MTLDGRHERALAEIERLEDLYCGGGRMVNAWPIQRTVQNLLPVLRGILERHLPCDYNEPVPGTGCFWDDQPWPCPDVAAVYQALGA